MRDGWRAGRIGDLVQESRAERLESPWEYDLLTVGLDAKGLRPTGKRPNRTKSGRPHYIRRSGEILVGRQNAHRRCVGLVNSELDGLVTSNAISAFVPREGVDPTFALLAIQSPETAEAADQVMGGTGQREVSVENYLSIEVQIPPLAEQRRIVDLIAAVDDAIEAANDLIGEVETLLSVGRRPQPDWAESSMRSAVTRAQSGVSSKLVEGTGPRKSLLALSALRPATFDPSGIKDVGVAPLPESVRVENGDLLITRANTPSMVGYVAIAEGLPDSTYMPDLVWRLTVDEETTSPEFMEQILSSTRMRARIAGIAGGSNPSMVKINKTNFFNLNVPMPSRTEQESYLRPIRALSDTRSNALDVLAALRTLRANLLTALLSGEHEIPASYDRFLEEVSA